MLTERDCLDAVEARDKANGDLTKAASSLGLNFNTYTYRLKIAAHRGFCGTNPVIPGFGIKQISTQTAEGKKEREWVKQGPLTEGGTFELPPGFVLDRMSTLTDGEGRVILNWAKSKFEQGIADATRALKASFEAYKGHATLPKAPKQTDKDLLTVYPVADHHLGLYAWAEEAGEDYDLKIGEQLLRDSMADLVVRSPSSETGIILNLGDFFHSDTNANRTLKSGNQLDVDSRYAKILRVGVDLMIHSAQLALQKHKNVIVRCLPGNHDPYSSIALSTGLACFFHNNPRVKVDADPSAFWKLKFGKVLLTATHGDNVKAPDMPGLIAGRYPKDWGETEHRYAYLGHFHHRSIGGGEKAGMIWEIFQTLTPKDEWGYRTGFVSGRSMTAITHHKEKGEICRSVCSVRGPR